MAKLGTITFTGISGETYHLNVYFRGSSFKKNYGAVYLMTRCEPNPDGGYSHTRTYVGQTDDLSTRFDSHHKQLCFDRYNANCVCILGEQDEDTRLAISQDLIDKYHPPCND